MLDSTFCYVERRRIVQEERGNAFLFSKTITDKEGIVVPARLEGSRIKNKRTIEVNSTMTYQSLGLRGIDES